MTEQISIADHVEFTRMIGEIAAAPAKVTDAVACWRSSCAIASACAGVVAATAGATVSRRAAGRPPSAAARRAGTRRTRRGCDGRRTHR